jgi:predicted alpha/beta-hydrolase family hydrolase
MSVTETRIDVAPDQQVSALLQTGTENHCLLVLGHGAGAGMHHPFMCDIAENLAQRNVATLRYQFPYMQRGRRSPDSRKILLASVRAAVAHAHGLLPNLPLFLGGKSMGGRMASLAMSEQANGLVRGLVFVGFPLHNAGKHGNERADHLLQVPIPMLFLQGTRDKLADLAYLQPVCERLGAQATLHIVEDGDHSFAMLKRSGRTQAEALVELADTIHSWTHNLSN